MLTPSFTKLQRCIITSSIWLEDNETRLVWITLLALCDRDGVARCSPRGLAHQARVSDAGCEKAVKKLASPDKDSRDMTDGRRIERVEGGYRILNYEAVLSEGAREDRRDYFRQKKAEQRAKAKAKGGTVRPEHVGKKNGKPSDELGQEERDGRRTMTPREL